MFLHAKKISFLLVVFFSLGAFGLIWSLTDTELEMIQTNRVISANRNSTIKIELQYKNPIRKWLTKYSKQIKINFLSGQKLVSLIPSENTYYLQSKGRPGLVQFRLITHEGKNFVSELRLSPGYDDYDLDGFPDDAELSSHDDRENFKEWFVTIAESQFYKMAPHWFKIHRHCAGLLIFAYKEALKEHSKAWHQKYPYLIKNNIPDVKQFNYPKVPILKTALFRVKSGKFRKKDINEGAFSPTADVNHLLNYNLSFISKQENSFQKGDVLFFYRKNQTKMPYHSMIFTGESGYLIYHTGPLGEKPGEVRKVLLSDLKRHPDSVWRPVPDNPNFLGAYRWKIIQ